MSATSKKGLGRGLSALFGDEEIVHEDGAANVAQNVASGSRLVPLSSLEPCPFQPRRNFDNASLAELGESMKSHGVLQPLLVRPSPHNANKFQIIAGERRWRAAQRANLHELPVVVRDFDDRSVLEIGLIENLQRENLQPIEEAETYKKLLDEHNYTQEDLSRVIGKSRSHIANMLRLLALPAGVQALLMTGKLTAGHGRALVGLENAQELAEDIARRGLSVREAEQLAAKANAASGKTKRKSAALKNANIRALEEKLSHQIGWKVSLDAKKNGSGKIVIPYKNLDQLDALLRRFGQ